MEQTALFEEKVFLTPKDMNQVSKKTLDEILLGHLKAKLENKCSKHGFVIPGSLSIVSRSMGQLENGRFTGNIVFYIHAEGRVYNPVNGTRLHCKVIKKNKMGLYSIYQDAIRILVPRDLHIGNETFDEVQLDQDITVEIRKSRFQINDDFILSVGVLVDTQESSQNSLDSKTTNNSVEGIKNVKEVNPQEESKEDGESKEDEESKEDDYSNLIETA